VRDRSGEAALENGTPKPKMSFFCGEAARVTITAHAVGGTITVIVLFEVDE